MSMWQALTRFFAIVAFCTILFYHARRIAELEFRAAVDPIAEHLVRQVAQAKGDIKAAERMCFPPTQAQASFHTPSVHGAWHCLAFVSARDRESVSRVEVDVQTLAPMGEIDVVGKVILHFDYGGRLYKVERVRGRPYPK